MDMLWIWIVIGCAIALGVSFAVIDYRNSRRQQQTLDDAAENIRAVRRWHAGLTGVFVTEAAKRSKSEFVELLHDKAKEAGLGNMTQNECRFAMAFVCEEFASMNDAEIIAQAREFKLAGTKKV